MEYKDLSNHFLDHADACQHDHSFSQRFSFCYSLSKKSGEAKFHHCFFCQHLPDTDLRLQEFSVFITVKGHTAILAVFVDGLHPCLYEKYLRKKMTRN